MNENCDQSYWENILSKDGLGIVPSVVTELNKAGFNAGSLEEMAKTEHEIKEALDKGVETENLFSSEIPLNKSGLPPCKRAKLENERNIQEKDSRLKS